MAISLPDVNALSARLGLHDQVPLRLAQELAARLDPLVPKDTGALANSVLVTPAGSGRCLIRYDVPYARTVYYTHPTAGRWLDRR